MPVIWSPTALREIEHIYRYIAQLNPRAAANLAQEILRIVVNRGGDLRKRNDHCGLARR